MSKVEPISPFTFLEWVGIRVQQLKCSEQECLAIRAAANIDEDRWAATDRHWLAVITDEVVNDREEHRLAYAAACNAEILRRRNQPKEPPQRSEDEPKGANSSTKTDPQDLMPAEDPAVVVATPTYLRADDPPVANLPPFLSAEDPSEEDLSETAFIPHPQLPQASLPFVVGEFQPTAADAHDRVDTGTEIHVRPTPEALMALLQKAEVPAWPSADETCLDVRPDVSSGTLPFVRGAFHPPGSDSTAHEDSGTEEISVPSEAALEAMRPARSLEEFADLSGRLARGELREEVLRRAQLTEEGFNALSISWAQRFAWSPALQRTFLRLTKRITERGRSE